MKPKSLLDWCATFEFPELDRDVEYVALQHPDEYPMNEGRIASTRGLDIDAFDYEEAFHRGAGSTLDGSSCEDRRERGPYICGPQARFALNAEQPLSAGAGSRGSRRTLTPENRESVSLDSRSGCGGDLRIRRSDSDHRKLPAASRSPRSKAKPQAGRGAAATEAPRGLLYHRYNLDAEANILEAKIVPPTSQNQCSIEDDLRAIAPTLAALPHSDARARAEHAIRNYDPCISCATHFLRLTIERN